MDKGMSTTLLPGGITIEEKLQIRPGEIEDIFETLITNRENPKMLEGVFAGVFLPIILGTVDGRNTDWLDRWMNEVGSLQLPVDIFSNSTKEYLFTAPPLFTFADFNSKYNSVGFGRILQESMRVGSNFAIVGERYLEDNLAAKADELTEGKVFNTDERWAYIFNRYGYEVADGVVVKIPLEELQRREASGSNSKEDNESTNKDDAILGLFDFG